MAHSVTHHDGCENILVGQVGRADQHRINDNQAQAEQQAAQERCNHGQHIENDERRDVLDRGDKAQADRFDRVSAADVQLRDRRLAFHIGEEPPRVTRYRVEGDA